jgi:hypothetical protein
MRNKYEGVIRPIVPTHFIIEEGVMSWDNADAVYDMGAVERLEGKEWSAVDYFTYGVYKLDVREGKYRLRVKYNSHWSDYIYPAVSKVVEMEPVKEVKKKTTKKKSDGKKKVSI